MKRGVRHQLFILILGIGVIPIVLAGTFLGWQSWNTQIEQSFSYQREIGYRAMSDILNFVHISKDHLSLVSRLFDLKNMQQKSQQDILSLMAAHKDETHRQMFRDIAIFNTSASVLACFSRINVCSEDYLKHNFSETVIKESLETGQDTYGSILFDMERGHPTLLVAHPIRHPVQNQTLGVLAANIRFKELWAILNTLPNRADVSPYLLNKSGLVVAHPNPSVVLRGSRLERPGKEGVRKGLLNQWAVLVKHDFFLGDQEFILVVERPLIKALAVTIQGLLAIGAMILITCVCALFLAVMMARRIVRPVNRLAIKARQISRGDLTQKVEWEGTDEFGLLARAFNSMSSDIDMHIRSLNQSIEEKERAYQSLAQSYAEMEELSYISSHHLQEPVRVIANYTELMEKKCSDLLDDSGKRYLFHIRRKGVLLKEMLSDVMGYLSLNQMTVKKEAVDVAALALKVAKKVCPESADDIFAIDLKQLPVIHTDKRLLGVALEQLFDNALKYNDNSSPRVTVTSRQSTPGWQVSIRDNGIGVDAEYCEKVFKLFNRLHGNEAYSGTGIGLSFSRKIISMLGGNFIRLEPNEGEGACVTFHLPD